MYLINFRQQGIPKLRRLMYERCHKEKCANHSVDWEKCWAVSLKVRNVCMKALNEVVSKLRSETSDLKILFSYIKEVKIKIPWSTEKVESWIFEESP